MAGAYSETRAGAYAFGSFCEAEAGADAFGSFCESEAGADAFGSFFESQAGADAFGSFFESEAGADAFGSFGGVRPGAVRCLILLVVLLVSMFGVVSNRAVAQDKLPTHPDGVLAREDPVVEAVGLADWPVLDKALKRPKPASGRIVSFRELWSARPGLADEPVIISGVIYRRFRSEPRGQFPSLEELWIRTDDDGLAVVTNVVPPKSATPERDRTEPGSPVRMIAFFLRKIRYEAEDEPRIAPWLVAKGFENESAEAVSSVSKDFEEAGDSIVLFVILATIAAVTVLRLLLLWAERTRRRTEAVREAQRERAQAITEGRSHDLRPGGGP